MTTSQLGHRMFRAGLSIGFGQHSVELLIGSKSFDLDGVLKLSLARIGEVVHESDGVVQGVESESCGQCFCDGIFYDPVAFECERETLVGFFIIFDVVSTCVIRMQIRESSG